jgi:hypothetical protein
VKLRSSLLALAAFAATANARASNPLEYPDNGSAAFSRGGAWLAVANEPIATHYNPAGLATQASGFSVEAELALPHTCFDRRGPGNAPVGPDDVGTPIYQYRPVCSAREGFPNTIPSIAVVYRVSSRLGLGIAVVPPATYGTAQGQFPPLASGVDTRTGQTVALPAPYRYLGLEQQSTILYPTLGIGYELSRFLRVGIGFIAGVGVINLSTAGVAQLGGSDAAGDHMKDDSLSTLRTEDLFVPGVVVGLHGSITRHVDVALWGRYLDAIRANHGSLDVTQQPFNGNGGLNPPCAGAPGANGMTDFSRCTTNQAVPNHFEHAVVHFEYPIPPELRAGVRFHLPRSEATAMPGTLAVRDPLHDDVFDVELDGSYTKNSAASLVEVRFPSKPNGQGTLNTNPLNVAVPPNADRDFGYRDSAGVRFGGQWNAVRDLVGVRAGAWFESQSQDPAFLVTSPVGAARYGFGGGVVVRYHFLDVSVGYQRHLSEGLDNHGSGAVRAIAAAENGGLFTPGVDPANVSEADRKAFRTVHVVNGGSVAFDAHVFTLGAVARF